MLIALKEIVGIYLASILINFSGAIVFHFITSENETWELSVASAINGLKRK